ncbi:hypothetical protein jhhlp_002448 [Lomentospora prolificans]|uniref:Uncharacterized protein n=1 Tax=Lomentospora prolificans TaxID=41688 RepID=A0A2N3NEA2_9PEZI|nr:hypothetical protein jhhlp_002448 [Lomentospora prolificans]
MISMQRSLSSPVCISSPSRRSSMETAIACETAERGRNESANASNPGPSAVRSPTPPPTEDRPDAPQSQQRFGSRSPSRAPSDTVTTTTAPASTRRNEDGSKRPLSLQPPSSSASRRPIIAQPVIRPSTPVSQPAAIQDDSPEPVQGEREQAPPSLASTLLPDLSLYTNPDPVPDSDTTTLEELAHLVRLSKYQERKRANTRIRLQRSLISAALSARLTRCGEMAHRNLVDCFRTDDKKTFASLYNAIHDVRKSCDELRRYTLLEPEMDSLNPSAFNSSENLGATNTSVPDPGASGSLAPFLNDISASAREVFLNFLTQIRTNQDFLAARLCSLSNSELTALTSFHQGLEPIESVLPSHLSRPPAPRANASTAPRNAGHSTNTVGRLLSFQRHDPLSALIHTCFANSAGPDSSEDRRKTQIWAAACSRLISEAKSSLEPFLLSVLNAWSSMRDWSGRSNMEWYLMKILEDGAFLLARAEDQHGTRFHISGWAREGNNTAAEDFYQRAVGDLFSVIDDDDATGIPEGFLELGNEIIKQLDPQLADSTRRFLVCKWLFQTFLLRALIHPESHGMMAEYHITEYGRQKILWQVAMRAMQYVAEYASWTKKAPLSIPSKIQMHIENIFNKLRGTHSPTPIAKLLPARSVTSLRETVEVHPYLVISPADLLTMVNALYPEQRPHSRASSSLRSGAPSISGFSAISQPMSIASRNTGSNNFDTSSVLSNSLSSVISDGASSKELSSLDQRTGTPLRYTPPAVEALSSTRTSTYEDDGYRLRLALHEMSQTLGLEVMSGSCHPCAERWAVLFISSDGCRLSSQMTFDPDDDADEDESSSTTDTDEGEEEDGLELDKEYSQLRDSIIKLVQDYEIPRTLAAEGNRTQLSNRATGIKKYRHKNKIITSENSTRSRNPYYQRSESTDAQASSLEGDTAASGDSENQESSVLVAMLRAASAQSRAQSDFVSAHLYWKTLQQLNSLKSPSLRQNGFAVLLNIFSWGPKDSIRRSAAAIEDYDAWLVWLKQSQERLEGHLDGMSKRLRALRDKMWYVTDVHNSAPYEHSRNICVALKTMGLPRRWRMKANTARGSSATYIYRTESQIMELLAATEEQGGPNKLSDDQAEKTMRWLQQYGIESWFCKGEERIHRFCLEVDNCIGKLIGDSMVDAPVLWSSELYLRDRKILESNKGAAPSRDRDSFWGGDDASSILSDSDRRFGTGTRPLATLRDLRNLSGFNSSQQSFDSSRFSFSRVSANLSDIVDGQDYFGASSPVHTIDSTTTFWSPFQSTMSQSNTTSRAHSPTSSVTNLSSTFSHQFHNPMPSITSQSTGRPGTATSSNETVYQQRLSEEKAKFLLELRQTLTSLLLSDLGNLVFVRGSETDAWFDDLGQQCIDLQESTERKARRAAVAAAANSATGTSTPTTKKDKAAGPSPRPRVIEKKKSFGNLRGAGETLGSSKGPGENAAADTLPGPGHESSTASASDTLTARSRTSNRGGGSDFPYKKAYQRLLRMFTIHPNPYVKLNTLHELKHLILSSLTLGGSKRSRLALARSELQAASAIEEQGLGQNPLEDAIDNMKERRSQSTMQPAGSALPTGAQFRPTGSDGKIPGTANASMDSVVMEVLLSLFKDSGIRPKTLFRDLQFIAAFVSPSVLDKTDKGTSFWDAGLTAIRLKQEVCQTMIKVTDNVIEHYTSKRKQASDTLTSQSDGSEQPTSMSPPPVTSKYTLADAVRMVIITAKEGHAASQRELGLFYLSHPELIDRVTLPLSKPREVFKQAIMEKYGGGTGRGGSSVRHPADRERARTSGGAQLGAGDEGGEDVRSDPALMCVALHWMQAADQGGDKIATDFIRQQGLV